MTQYWFRAKKYGFGSYPIAWQGWISILLLVIFILIIFCADIAFRRPITVRDWMRYGIDVVMAGALFLVLTKDTTEGGLRWRWGNQ
jgi:hypothetical protein